MATDEMVNNKVYLSGTLVGEPVFTHEVLGEGFYEIKLAVKRLSEQTDIIPVTVSERLLFNEEMPDGRPIALSGQFRSYNRLDDGKSRLILTVFARELLVPDEGVNPNSIEITGFVCKTPIFRVTPFKREICDMLLAVNRAYNKSDYIPCIAWGRNARFASSFSVGEKLFVSGRIQSREYQKTVGEDTVTKVAYEVSVAKIETITE